MTVKVQPQKVVELNKEIASLRKTAVWRAAMKDPTVAKELENLASIAVKAISDAELKDEEKTPVIVECAEAIATVGNSRRSYGAVMTGVRNGLKEIEGALAGTGLEHNGEVIEALETARRSVMGGGRYLKKGGAGNKTTAREKEKLAADYMYGEYCKLNGVPTDEVEIRLAVEWIRNKLGGFSYSKTWKELEAHMKEDVEKQD